MEKNGKNRISIFFYISLLFYKKIINFFWFLWKKQNWKKWNLAVLFINYAL